MITYGKTSLLIKIAIILTSVNISITLVASLKASGPPYETASKSARSDTVGDLLPWLVSILMVMTLPYLSLNILTIPAPQLVSTLGGVDKNDIIFLGPVSVPENGTNHKQ